MKKKKNIKEIKNEIEKKPSKIRKWFVRSILFLLLFIFFTIVGAFVSLQFKSVRSTILDFVESSVNQSLNAKLNIDDFTLVSLKAVKLYNASLVFENKDTVVFVPEANAIVNLSAILDGKIFIRNLELYKPKVNMLRDSLGVWNVSLIPIPSNDTTPAPDTKIMINNLKFVDGDFRMFDPYDKNTQSKGFNTSNLHLQNLNFAGGLFIRPTKKKLVADLIGLSFYESNMKRKLKPTDLVFLIDSNYAKIEDLNYKSGNSSLQLNAEIGIDIFGGVEDGDIEKAKISVDADFTQVDVKELFALLDIPAKFKGTYDFALKVDGTMDKMNIQKFDLKLDNSKLKVRGKIKSALESNKIDFDLTANGSYLNYEDVISFLDLDRQNLPNFKYANFSRLKMTGKPNNLKFDLDVNSGVGNLNGKLIVNNNKNLDIYYDGEIQSINVNSLYPNTITTNLNGQLKTELLGVNSNNRILNVNYNGASNSIDDYKMSHLKVDLKSNDFKKVQLDTLYAEFGSTTSGYTLGKPEKSFIIGQGQLDISDKSNSKYNLQLDYNAINLKQLLDSDKMPNYLSGSSKLQGRGIEINNITGEFDTKIRDIVFEDRAFFPFDFNLKIDKYSEKDRKIEFNSDFGSIIMEGDYNFENTLASLQNQGYSLYNFVANEINKLIPDDQKVVKKLELNEVEKIGKFNHIDANLKINVSDFSFLTAFMDSTNLRMNTDLNFHIFANDNESSLYINSLDLTDLYYNSGTQTITSKGLSAEGGLYMKLKDSSAIFSDFKLKTKAKEQITFNDIILNYPTLNLEYDGKEFKFDGLSDINNQLDIRFDGNTTIIPGGVELGFTKLDISYQNEYNLSLTEPIKAQFVNGGFLINSMELTNPDTKERINISGEYNANSEQFNDFKIALNKLDLKAIKTFIPRESREQFDQMHGTIDSLKLVINGDLNSPLMNLHLVSNDIKVNEQMVGDIYADLNYKNMNISGDLLIDHYSNDEKMPNLVKGEITSFPINLSMGNVESRFLQDKPANMEFAIDSLPLSIISPFVPSISYLKGIGKGKLLVKGNFPDNLKFDGIVRFDNTSFLVDATNVGYKAKGGLILKDNKVFLDNVKVYNLSDDLSNGKADVSGVVNLENLDISGFDIGVKTNRFLVLNDESQKVKNDLFGRLIISTGRDSLRFYGSFEKPNLDGYVSIESADLKMPDEEEVQLVRSKFIYKRVGDEITASYGRADSVKVKKTIRAQEVSESLFDLLNIDMDVEFKGRTQIDMQINQFLRTNVIVGTPINTRNIRYVKNRNSKEAKLYGQIILKEGSKLSFFKTFDITGDIDFPTGNISNPTLDLKAEYDGTTVDYKKFKVEIFVTGTKENPNLRFEYEVGGETGYGDKEKKLSDIISLLLTGRTPNQTTTNNNGNDINIQSTVASDILTRQVAQELGKLGLSAQIDFDENFDNAKVKIGGDIIGGARWSFGGNVNDISGSRIEIEIPLDDLVNLTEEDWINILLNFTYVNSPETVKTDENQIHWEGKLKFGGSW